MKVSFAERNSMPPTQRLVRPLAIAGLAAAALAAAFIARPQAAGPSIGAAAASPAAELTAAQATGAAPARRYKLQLGAWFASAYGSQESFINIAAARNPGWVFAMPNRQGFMQDDEAVEAGLLDPDTLEFTAKASKADAAASNEVMVDAARHKAFYAEDWTLDWRGDAYGYVHGWDNTAEINRTKTSVTYRLRPASVRSGQIRFSQIRSAVTDIRLYRTRFKSELDAGKIWSPIFLAEAKKYDIIRTMDLQGTNNSPVRRFDQIAKMDELWGQRYGLQYPEVEAWGVPFEALFALGVESGADIWLNIPPQIGAQTPVGHPSLKDERWKGAANGDKLRMTTAAATADILASPEWERFADEFLARYFASDYPKDRPLYIEVGNEIWNYGAGFYASTHYAHGIAEGMGLKGGPGSGYGALTARWMIALDAALAKRKANANFVYVLATQTANPWRTQMAFEGFVTLMEQRGRPVKPALSRLAVAATSYYGYFQPMSKAVVGAEDGEAAIVAWEREIARDPEGLARRFSDIVLNGPPNMVNTTAWNLANWREHRKIAEKFGARFLGAYEGGSHLDIYGDLKKSGDFRRWWTEFHWGPRGAEIARAYNRALLAEFPDAVLANYVGSGGDPDLSAPWTDGHYAEPTALSRVWDEFADPARRNP